MEMSAPKRFVYILKSESQPNRYYTGLASNLAARLDAHNAGRCPHTASNRPWRLDVVVKFADERRAVAFERYLKSGSGNAFAKRHLR
jgi:predicted GIY-YIG superfamily endonuclease